MDSGEHDALDLCNRISGNLRRILESIGLKRVQARPRRRLGALRAAAGKAGVVIHRVDLTGAMTGAPLCPQMEA